MRPLKVKGMKKIKKKEKDLPSVYTRKWMIDHGITPERYDQIYKEYKLTGDKTVFLELIAELPTDEDLKEDQDPGNDEETRVSQKRFSLIYEIQDLYSFLLHRGEDLSNLSITGLEEKTEQELGTLRIQLEAIAGGNGWK